MFKLKSGAAMAAPAAPKYAATLELWFFSGELLQVSVTFTKGGTEFDAW